MYTLKCTYFIIAEIHRIEKLLIYAQQIFKIDCILIKQISLFHKKFVRGLSVRCP